MTRIRIGHHLSLMNNLDCQNALMAENNYSSDADKTSDRKQLLYIVNICHCVSSPPHDIIILTWEKEVDEYEVSL